MKDWQKFSRRSFVLIAFLTCFALSAPVFGCGGGGGGGGGGSSGSGDNNFDFGDRHRTWVIENESNQAIVQLTFGGASVSDVIIRNLNVLPGERYVYEEPLNTSAHANFSYVLVIGEHTIDRFDHPSSNPPKNDVREARFQG